MYQKVGPLLMVVAIVFLTASSGLQGQNNRIVTITSSPQLGVETVCDNHNVTLMCHTDQTTGNMITWYWSNQSQHRANITVMAMMTEVVYTCVVSDNEGKANVTVRANETPPHVERIDFFNYIRRHEGSNLTLSAKVSSNIPLLAGYPKWAVDFNLSLPSTAMVDNYTINGTIYSNLTLYELSFENDTGNYTFTAENKCGSSFVYVYIDVRKVPSVPTNLTAKALSHDQIKITWGPVADNGGADVNSFVLKVAEVDTGTLASGDRQLPGNIRVASLDGLKDNTKYCIEVAAVNYAGQGNTTTTTVTTLTLAMTCTAARERIRNHYTRLTNLRISSILTLLYSNGTITHDEKKYIDSINSDRDKMTNFLDNILIPSLNNSFAQKYIGFLKALKEADDLAMNSMATEIGPSS
ncbi:titin-like isoform X5 [Dysidea avara]|uniref:titin-like isoform X5 n=1 Tax=Dysidea avara TaxID=196820 RepID=UPI003331DB2E